MRSFKTIQNILGELPAIKKIYLIGCTGAGKTSLVQHIIGSEKSGFPVTTQRRTTIAPTEYVIKQGGALAAMGGGKVAAKAPPTNSLNYNDNRLFLRVKLYIPSMATNRTKPHSRDLRKGRHSANNQIYSVTTVTHQRQKVFTDFSFGRLVVDVMRNQHQQQKVDSLAFVIMPDHIHWLFALQNDSSLAEVMRSVKGCSAHQIQAIRRERGNIIGKQALWQDGYHDHAVRKEEDLQQIARYIVANPLRAGLVKKVADYPLWDAIWL